MDIKHINYKYKDKFLHIAFIVSGWSTQPSGKQHGCVLALDGKYIVATGFNGFDRHYEGPEPEIVHAEVNATINAGLVNADLTRCVAFVTKKPCLPCRQHLMEKGVKAMFWLQGDAGFEVLERMEGNRGYSEQV